VADTGNRLEVAERPFDPKLSMRLDAAIVRYESAKGLPRCFWGLVKNALEVRALGWH